VRYCLVESNGDKSYSLLCLLGLFSFGLIESCVCLFLPSDFPLSELKSAIFASQDLSDISNIHFSHENLVKFKHRIHTRSSLIASILNAKFRFPYLAVKS